MSKETLVTFHWPGDSADMQARYDRVLEQVVAVSSARPMVHLAVPVDDGFRVYDLWSNEEIARRMLDNPDFQARLAEVGLDHGTITVTPVHRMGWPVSVSPMYR